MPTPRALDEQRREELRQLFRDGKTFAEVQHFAAVQSWEISPSALYRLRREARGEERQPLAEALRAPLPDSLGDLLEVQRRAAAVLDLTTRALARRLGRNNDIDLPGPAELPRALAG